MTRSKGSHGRGEMKYEKDLLDNRNEAGTVNRVTGRLLPGNLFSTIATMKGSSSNGWTGGILSASGTKQTIATFFGKVTKKTARRLPASVNDVRAFCQCVRQESFD